MAGKSGPPKSVCIAHTRKVAEQTAAGPLVITTPPAASARGARLERSGTRHMFILRDLSPIAHDVSVMHLGSVVELGAKRTIFGKPLHPYTGFLMSATRSLDATRRQVKILQLHGKLPSPLNLPSGCTFHQRCPYAKALCSQSAPQLRPLDGRLAACHRIKEIDA